MKIGDHLITSIDTIMRKDRECGIIITGDFNQMQVNFIKPHRGFVQVVNIITCNIIHYIYEYGEGMHPACYYFQTRVIGP